MVNQQFSPISNPINLSATSKSSDSHLVEGGLLSDNSGKFVSLKITNIDSL